MPQSFVRQEDHPSSIPDQAYRIYAEDINELQIAIEEESVRTDGHEGRLDTLDTQQMPNDGIAGAIHVKSSATPYDTEWDTNLNHPNVTLDGGLL